MTEHEVAGGHHRLHGHEFEQAPGVGDEQGSLACCHPCTDTYLCTCALRKEALEALA